MSHYRSAPLLGRSNTQITDARQEIAAPEDGRTPRRAMHKTTKDPLFIAIVGGSGSGKSWLAERLQARLGRRAIRLSLDSFYKDRSHLPPQRRDKLNFDHPAAIDWNTFHQALEDLLNCRSARVPSYDFKTHSRGPHFKIVKPAPIILVDGLWLLRRPAIRRFFTLRIFLQCPTHLRLGRRLKRDLASRGRTRSSVLNQFQKTVEPMHLKYVAPQIRLANIVLKGNWGSREANRIANSSSAIFMACGERRADPAACPAVR